LVEGGLLFLVIPTLDSQSAKLLGEHWTEWRPENLFYFDDQTIQSLLIQSGFENIRITPDKRQYALDHLYQRVDNLPQSRLTRTTKLLHSVAPSFLHSSIRFRLPYSRIMVACRKGEKRSRPLVSIIMPVFNEKNTFEETLEAVLAKPLPGLEKEIVIVESNSTDGTRDLVLKYQKEKQIKVFFEETPLGKGHAVRRGLQEAGGDFLLIQDADQEYDVNDYDLLLRPLVLYQKPFILGSRHIGDWKIREFNRQPGLTGFFNVGHFIFATLLNLMYGTRLKDPFTMYKVFRRDCLYGMEFECNRFDFDFELVEKMVRKGYIPLEIPINYRSRSYSEGKKVSFWKDVPRWLRALLKYRFYHPEDDEK